MSGWSAYTKSKILVQLLALVMYDPSQSIHSERRGVSGVVSYLVVGMYSIPKFPTAVLSLHRVFHFLIVKAKRSPATFKCMEVGSSRKTFNH